MEFATSNCEKNCLISSELGFLFLRNYPSLALPDFLRLHPICISKFFQSLLLASSHDDPLILPTFHHPAKTITLRVRRKSSWVLLRMRKREERMFLREGFSARDAREGEMPPKPRQSERCFVRGRGSVSFLFCGQDK